MPKEVVAALIAVGGVIFTQLITYAISRQSARDLRVNIDREIEIIKKLRPGSDEAQRLELHVKASIDKLIARDERREQLLEILATSAPIPVLAAAALGLGFWREHGVPPGLSPLVTMLYWGLFGLLLYQVWLSGWRFGKFLFAFLQAWVHVMRRRRAMMQIIKMTKRSLAEGRQELQGLIATLHGLEEKVIQSAGQDGWDTLIQLVNNSLAHHDIAETEIAQVERDMKALKPARQLLKIMRQRGGDPEAPPSPPPEPAQTV